MQCQWTAITVQEGHGWVAYFEELPQAVAAGRTQDEARETLDWAVAMILEAGRGGAELADLPEEADASDELDASFVQTFA